MTPAFALLLLIPQDTAPRLNMRFEVLWRVREFERNWMTECAPSGRVAALQVLENDSANCIASDSGQCAQRIDIAQEALTAGRFRSLHPNLGLAVSQRLCDRSKPTTYLHAPRVYNVEPLDWILKEMCLSVSGRSCGELSVDDEAVASSDLVRPVRLGLGRTTEGDLSFDASLWPGDWPIHLTTLQLSIVERRDERLAALTKALDTAAAKGPQLELATARMQLALLESLAQGSTEVHEYPGARLLAETEAVVTAALNGERWYGLEHTGEYWLALPCGATTVRTRVLVPEGLSKESPAPLVLALHGAVFDEDTWFDGYGGGQSAELACQRGWLFAAPHCEGTEDATWLAALVKALSDVYPLDASRVALIGHDRGGVVALKALAQVPAPWRAVATLGAWIDPSSAQQLAARQLFLGVGEHDFLHAAAVLVNDSETPSS